MTIIGKNTIRIFERVPKRPTWEGLYDDTYTRVSVGTYEVTRPVREYRGMNLRAIDAVFDLIGSHVSTTVWEILTGEDLRQDRAIANDLLPGSP